MYALKHKTRKETRSEILEDHGGTGFIVWKWDEVALKKEKYQISAAGIILLRAVKGGRYLARFADF